MKYLVIGAGGTGGCISGFMGKAGKDVTVIARGEHLNEIKKNGLTIEGPSETFNVKINACTMDEYNESPDVIFVCVKGYSLEDTVPFIERVAGDHTVVIPILNIYGTGGKLQEKLPNVVVTDGCIYVASQIKKPGTIQMNGTIFRVVYGLRDEHEYDNKNLKFNVNEVLKEIEKDLKDSNITPILSENIQRDALQKFSYVSPPGACGQYYDVNSEAIQKPGEVRDTFVALIREIEAIATAMDIHFEVDIVETNLKILDALAPDSSTSMQRDVRAGKASEMDGLIFEVVRLGKKLGVSVPTYEKVAAKYGFTI